MIESNNSSIYFKPLTGVRAIAAFMVYMHHFNPLSDNYSSTIFFGFIQEMHVGVTIFFVLSGFLIAYRYSEMKYFSFRKYMLNRFARIYPMYFILTTLTFILYAVLLSQNKSSNFYEYLLNISFIRGLFDNLKFSGIAQGWSLTVEETFYIIAPLIFLLANKRMFYLILLPILFLFTGIGLVTIFSKIEFYSFFSNYEFMFNYTFFGRCMEFFIGIILAVFYKQQTNKSSFKYFTYMGLMGMILSIFILSMLKGNYDYGIRHPLGKVINTFVLPLIGICPFFYGLLRESSVISKMLSSKLFVLLGKSSYVFYLIHMGVFSLLLRKFTSNYLLIFISLNILAIILYKYLEEPINLYIRNTFFNKTKSSNKLVDS